MDSNKKKELMENIKKYGELCAENKKYTARKLLESIDKSVLTDREQFFKYLEEA